LALINADISQLALTTW